MNPQHRGRNGSGRSFSHQHSRARSLLLALALCGTLSLPGSLPPAWAQTVTVPPSLLGTTHWSGQLTQNPPPPGITSGVWNVTMTMTMGPDGGAVMNGTARSASQDQYFIFSVSDGNLKADGTMPTTGAARQVNLPFGDFACNGNGTLTVTASTITESGTAGGAGSCGSTTASVVLHNDSGVQLGAPSRLRGCDKKVAAANGTVANPNEPAKGVCMSMAGEPIDMYTGNVYEEVTDYTTAGPNRLSFTRYYNGSPPVFSNEPAMFISRWRHNYDRYLNPVSSTQVLAERPDGQQVLFTLTGGVWTPPPGEDMALARTDTGWALYLHDDTVETYPATFNVNVGDLLLVGALPVFTITYRGGYSQSVSYNLFGQPASVTDSYGRALTFNYNGVQLASVTTPDALVISFAYNSSGIAPGVLDRLASVSYNTTPPSSVSYQYGNATFPFAITSILDENGNAKASFTYDGFGRATSSQGAGGADAYTIAYNDTTGTRTLTGALGNVDTYTFVEFAGEPQLLQIGRTLPNTTITRFFTYDAGGYLASATNWNGNKITFTNDAHGDPTTIVEASGTSVARTTAITYDSTFAHLPATVATPGLTTSYTYDASGNPLTQTLTDTTTASTPYSTNGQARTWTYSWSNFLPASITSPAGNVTRFAFDSTGALASVTNALSQSFTVTSHTGGGLPLSVTDPNGVVTNLAYDARNRLTSKTLITQNASLITSFAYDPAGNLLSVTQPDGAQITNSYDAAGRLTRETDLFGNSASFTLDALGDATATALKNPSGTATLTATAAFDKLGRQTSVTKGTGWVRQFTWDNNGNMATLSAFFAPGAGAASGHGYSNDALNRRTTDGFGGNATLTYDAHDRPLTATDRNGGVTSYIYDGFGDVIQVSSPDSGTTVYHYDADGNLTSKTDASSVTANYSYDALDRLASESYPADAPENVTYTYDQAGTGFGFGVGRPTSYTDAAGSHARSYDERGNLLTDSLITQNASLITSYSYDAASRVASVTYPSGVTASYARDSMGRVTSVSATPAGGSAQVLASNVTYKPFGPFAGLTFGNGINETLTWDLSYTLTSLTDTGTATVQNLSYQIGSGVGGTQDQVYVATDHVISANSVNSGYDTVWRQGGATATGINANSAYGAGDNRTSYGASPNNIAATYTAHSNRLASYTVGSGGTAVTTTVTTSARGELTGFSNPLVNITGNIVAPGPVTSLVWNNAGQLASASGPSGLLGTYLYDAFGNRTSKTTSAGTTLFTYARDGTLLEEISPTGVARDYIYLNGRPLALVDLVPGPSPLVTYSYLHDDPIGTPQVATSQSQAVLWRSTLMPFGTPISTTGPITVNLRRPGQYFDSETGLINNGFRTYVASLARYAQPDPIGLRGGWNDYAYVHDQPIKFTDRRGLDFFGTDQITPSDAQAMSMQQQMDQIERQANQETAHAASFMAQGALLLVPATDIAAGTYLMYGESEVAAEIASIAGDLNPYAAGGAFVLDPSFSGILSEGGDQGTSALLRSGKINNIQALFFRTLLLIFDINDFNDRLKDFLGIGRDSDHNHCPPK